MLNALFRFSDYLQYLITASGRHGLHSPFAYNLNEAVVRSKENPPHGDIIETTRRKMIRSRSKIEFTDFGAGGKSGIRDVSEIAAVTARSAKYGKFLYRFLKYLQPEFAIELGTGTGITALYQASALDPSRPLHTIEGSPKLTEIAAFNAESCGLSDRIIFHQGRFEQVLPGLLQQVPRVDYAYIDGNHAFDPTLDYFEMLLPKLHSGSALIFDDIHWSEEMKNAWAAIKNHPFVTVSIDIFAFGIVFFRQGQEKEHFLIRY